MPNKLLGKIIFGATLGIIVVLALLGIFWDPHFLLAAFGGLLAVFAFFSPRFGLGMILCFLIIGQVGRIEFLGELQAGMKGEILILDLLIPLVLLGWAARKIYLRESFPKISLTKYLLIFLGWMILGLVLALQMLPLNSVARDSFYLIRFFEYAAIIFLILDLIRDKKSLISYLKAIVAIGFILGGLGFLQLYFVPDFSFMVAAGWDPHQNRLLATWFDPNFLGGFLVLCLSLLIGIYYAEKKRGYRATTLIAGLFLAASIIFTYSRSAYLMLLLVLLLWGIFFARKLLAISLILLSLVVLFVPQVQRRVKGAIDFDTTVQSRVDSWRDAFVLVKKSPIFGVGYNTYRESRLKLQLITKKTSVNRSAAGSDSSLFTILATTGVIGAVIYLYLWFLILKRNLKLILKSKSPENQKLYFGIFVGLVGLFIHSFFVNSLLYPLIAIVFWIIVALLFQSESLKINPKKN